MPERSDKAVYVQLDVWFDQKVGGDNHLSIPGQGLSTVNGKASSKRGNPHLFNKLAKALGEQGRPHPSIVEEWGRG